MFKYKTAGGSKPMQSQSSDMYNMLLVQPLRSNCRRLLVPKSDIFNQHKFRGLQKQTLTSPLFQNIIMCTDMFASVMSPEGAGLDKPVLSNTSSFVANPFLCDNVYLQCSSLH